MNQEEVIKKIEEFGHILKTDEDGDVDTTALDTDGHNGPECAICGEMWCWHCVARGMEKVEKCKGIRFPGSYFTVGPFINRYGMK